MTDSQTTAFAKIEAGLTDAVLMVRKAKIIANYCSLRGWSPWWDQLSADERNMFIGVVETLENQSYAE